MTTDPCAMPVGYGATCQLPGDHPHGDGCQPAPARCKCSHISATHGTDRRGRAICWSAACGCASYRPEDVK